jgi:uncharacterized repeat protein (TIGR03803 family)
LYGTTNIGGTAGLGTIFKITTAGAETVLHSFGDGSVTNDGANPVASLLVYQNPATTSVTLFGTTQNGGAGGEGSVFELDSNNTLTILHSFDDGTVNNDGQNPMASLCVGSDGNLYGTTVGGGDGSGTVFAIVANLFPPPSAVPTNYWTCSGTLPPGMTFDPTTGAITGTPANGDAVGAYTVTITSPENVTTRQTYTLTQTFGQWMTAMSVTGSATDSPRNDGVPNLLKYLCDIDPTSSISAADRAALPTIGMTTSGGTDYVTLTYRQAAAASGVNVILQTSSDLQNWTTVSSPDIDQQMGTDPTTGDPIMEMGVKSTGAVQFLRMNVSSQ